MSNTFEKLLIKFPSLWDREDTFFRSHKKKLADKRKLLEECLNASVIITMADLDILVKNYLTKTRRRTIQKNTSMRLQETKIDTEEVTPKEVTPKEVTPKEVTPKEVTPEGKMVSSQTISSKTRIIETITYKTERNGVVETRVEQKITIQSDGDPIDHDRALAEAIQVAKAMNPDMMVEKIEVQQQSTQP